MNPSVVICTKNRPDDVEACIRSIAAQSRPPFELIVVDAGDVPDMGSRVRRWAESGEVVYAKTTPGLPHQRNVGVSLARSEYVLFLDDDVELYRDHIERLMEVFLLKGGTNIGGVQGTYVERSPGLSASALRHFFLLPSQDNWGRGRIHRSGAAAHALTPSEVVQVDVLRGGDMCFHRKVFQRFAFDTNLGGYAYGEDLDFSYRVSREFALFQTPWARLVHKASPVARANLVDVYRGMIWNTAYLHAKNLPSSVMERAAYFWSVLGYSVLFTKSLPRGAMARGLKALLEWPSLIASGRRAATQVRSARPEVGAREEETKSVT